MECFSLEKNGQSKEKNAARFYTALKARVNKDLLFPAPPKEDLKKWQMKKHSLKCSSNSWWSTCEISCAISCECPFLQTNCRRKIHRQLFTYSDFSLGSELTGAWESCQGEIIACFLNLPCSDIFWIRLSVLGSEDCKWGSSAPWFDSEQKSLGFLLLPANFINIYTSFLQINLGFELLKLW